MCRRRNKDFKLSPGLSSAIKISGCVVMNYSNQIQGRRRMYTACFVAVMTTAMIAIATSTRARDAIGRCVYPDNPLCTFTLLAT